MKFSVIIGALSVFVSQLSIAKDSVCSSAVAIHTNASDRTDRVLFQPPKGSEIAAISENGLVIATKTATQVSIYDVAGVLKGNIPIDASVEKIETVRLSHNGNLIYVVYKSAADMPAVVNFLVHNIEIGKTVHSKKIDLPSVGGLPFVDLIKFHGGDFSCTYYSSTHTSTCRYSSIGDLIGEISIIGQSVEVFPGPDGSFLVTHEFGLYLLRRHGDFGYHAHNLTEHNQSSRVEFGQSPDGIIGEIVRDGNDTLFIHDRRKRGGDAQAAHAVSRKIEFGERFKGFHLDHLVVGLSRVAFSATKFDGGTTKVVVQHFALDHDPARSFTLENGTLVRFNPILFSPDGEFIVVAFTDRVESFRLR